MTSNFKQKQLYQPVIIISRQTVGVATTTFINIS